MLDRLLIKHLLLGAFLAGLTLSSLLSCSARTAAGRAANPRLVELLPIELDPKETERREFGALTLLSAFELRSRDARFGGLSGLIIGADGRLYSVSDRGYWVSARMHLDSDHRLIDLSDWDIQRLLSPDGTPVRGPLTDSEALARAPDGSFLVAFEQVHRIWRYPPPPRHLSSPPVSVSIPAEIAKAPRNGGIEGITFLPDGSLLALTEEFKNADGSFKGWLIENDRFSELSYMPSNGYRVTDCAALKNGDVIVLERGVAPLGIFSARLKLVSGRDLRPGAQLVGEEILRLDPPLQVDNFEGIAIQQDPAKGTMIYIVSDDNYRWFQRTLLLQFRLNRTAD